MLLSQLYAHKGIRWITIGWTGFIAENLILSHNKEYLVTNFGEDVYHYGYTALSVAACASTIYGYVKYGKGSGPTININNRFWKIQSLPFRYCAFSLQTIGLIGLSQEFKSPLQFKTSNDLKIEGNYDLLKENQKYYVDIVCPIEHEPIKDKSDIIGIKRVCRYPIFWSNAFLWLGCSLKSIHYTSIIMFIFPTIFAFIGSFHQDYRYKKAKSLTTEIENNSCLFPFISLIKGEQSWRKLQLELKYPHLIAGSMYSIYLNWTLFFV